MDDVGRDDGGTDDMSTYEVDDIGRDDSGTDDMRALEADDMSADDEFVCTDEFAREERILERDGRGCFAGWVMTESIALPRICGAITLVQGRRLLCLWKYGANAGD